jgi:hypothetical protein
MRLKIAVSAVRFRPWPPPSARLLWYKQAVVYIFERLDEALQIETRYAQASKTFEIIWRRTDGTTTRESFKGETSFRSRLDEIRAELERDAWQTAGPHLLAEGWKI